MMDEQAFDTVYREYYRGLCAFASQYVERTECEEIVQEAMLWLWENRSALLPEIPVKHLLFTIVKNKCLNNITHTRMKQQVHQKLYAKFEEQFEDPDFYIENELLAKLEKAIEALPTDYRTAFTLNRFEDLTYNEIAERMNVSSKTIAYRISQALKLLRHALKEYMPLLL
jgi:RNA polymerase sigma-70 factor (ECF subfamily)